MILKRKNNLLWIGVLFALSCEKEELPVDPPEQGESQINEVGLGEDYRNQLYFDLETNTVVSSNLKTAWDLAWASTEDEEYVTLNTSKGMGVYRSVEDFASTNDVSGVEWRYDHQSGRLDSTAVGEWWNDQYVYVFDRGYDETGTHLGYFKLEVLSSNYLSIEIKYGDLSDNTGNTLTIIKSSTTAFTYFSVENGVVDIAPLDEEYDLIFTQYTHVFTDPITPYVVTGVLLNREKTTATIVDNMAYEEIDLNVASQFDFSADLDVIGYDWKTFDFDEGMYKIDSNMIFIIRTSEGYFYKFRFTGFYNQMGLKGYPSFEFQQL